MIVSIIKKISLTTALIFAFTHTALSYDKMEIFSFPWNMSLRLALDDPKEIIKSHFSVYIRGYLYDDNRIDAAIKELVYLSDEKPQDLKLVMVLHSKRVIDTLSIDAGGYVYRNGKKYFKVKSLVQFVSEYLPRKHVEALHQRLPDIFD